VTGIFEVFTTILSTTVALPAVEVYLQDQNQMLNLFKMELKA
jgi:hypothetical protein